MARPADTAAIHLRAIARMARPAGSDTEREARDYCAQLLNRFGFSIAEEPFAYSSAVGRWATPLAGAATFLVFTLAGHFGYRMAAPGWALGVLVGGAIALAWGGRLLARRGVLSLPFARRQGINLVATRGMPIVWLVAHLDSKSQPIPILWRATAVVVVAVLWLLAILFASLQLAGLPVAGIWPAISALGVLASIPILATTVGNNSFGAVDNASGVAAVLIAAELLKRETSVGVVLTSAEELGLAGARAWVKGRTPQTALNVDGVDDDGPMRCMYSGRAPHRILTRVTAGGRRVMVKTRIQRLFPGILTDSVAFTDAGWDAVTIARGTAKTLARIHTPRDAVVSLSGKGVADAARVLADLVQELS